jgi:ribosomal protein S6
MSETHMPAAEVNIDNGHDAVAYELAFHVLPTVAEGEVTTVFEAVQVMITKNGGVIVSSETPKRFDLAYEIVKFLEGRNRSFKSAYFGWVRFTLEPQALALVTEAIDGHRDILRYLCVKLTRQEEAHPFYFHEALATKRVRTVGEADEEVVELAEAEVDAVLEDEEVVEEEDATTPNPSA